MLALAKVVEIGILLKLYFGFWIDRALAFLNILQLLQQGLGNGLA